MLLAPGKVQGIVEHALWLSPNPGGQYKNITRKQPALLLTHSQNTAKQNCTEHTQEKRTSIAGLRKNLTCLVLFYYCSIPYLLYGEHQNSKWDFFPQLQPHPLSVKHSFTHLPMHHKNPVPWTSMFDLRGTCCHVA